MPGKDKDYPDALSSMGYTVEEVASMWRLGRMYTEIADRYSR